MKTPWKQINVEHMEMELRRFANVIISLMNGVLLLEIISPVLSTLHYVGARSLLNSLIRGFLNSKEFKNWGNKYYRIELPNLEVLLKISFLVHFFPSLTSKLSSWLSCEIQKSSCKMHSLVCLLLCCFYVFVHNCLLHKKWRPVKAL